MANKKSCVIYDSWGELLIGLPKDLAGEVIQAVCLYSFHGEMPEFENPASAGIFAMIKMKLDEDSKKYQEKVERINKVNECRNEIVTKSSQDRDENVGVSVSVSDNVSDNVSVHDTESPTETKKYTARHRMGEYGHVLLSDKDLEKLNAEYGDQDTQEFVQYLDEYIERKGYKAKNHYLTIRKWVVDAIKEERAKKSRASPMSATQYILNKLQEGAYDETGNG